MYILMPKKKNNKKKKKKKLAEIFLLLCHYLHMVSYGDFCLSWGSMLWPTSKLTNSVNFWQTYKFLMNIWKLCFKAIFTNGNNFCDFSFASLGSPSKIAFKEIFCSKNRNFFTSRVDPIEKGWKTKIAELLPLIIFPWLWSPSKDRPLLKEKISLGWRGRGEGSNYFR